MKTRLIIAIALFVVGATAISAQTIDGAKNPEQIPITLALRMWLSAFTHDAVIQAPQIGLSQVDAAALTTIMTDHRNRLEAVRTNQKNDPHMGRDAFWKAYTQLTEENWADIQTRLSRVGVLIFTNYLSHQKASMRPSAYDVALGAVGARNLQEAQMVASMSGMAGGQSGGMTPNYSAYNAVILGHSSNGVAAFYTNGGLGSNWTTTYGSFSISNGNLSVATGGGASGIGARAYWKYNSSPSWQQCSYAAIGTITGSNGMGPAINMSATAETFYAVYWNSTGANLVKAVNGTGYALGTYNYTVTSGDGLNICNDGAGHLTVTLNNSSTPILSATDTTIQSGYPGVMGSTYGGHPTMTLTTWAGGSKVTGITINANVTGDTICGMGGFCTGVTHTPHVANYNALRGSTVYGPGVSPQTYIDTYNNQAYPISDFTPGVDDIIYLGEVVNCSSEGIFFNVTPTGGQGPYWEQSELGVAMLKTIATQNEPGPYDIEDFEPYCSARTSPPDLFNAFWFAFGGAEWQPAAFITGVVGRAGGFGPFVSPWEGLAEGEMLDVLPTSKVDCTMWDNGWIEQIKGGRILLNTGGPQPAKPPVM